MQDRGSCGRGCRPLARLGAGGAARSFEPHHDRLGVAQGKRQVARQHDSAAAPGVRREQALEQHDAASRRARRTARRGSRRPLCHAPRGPMRGGPARPVGAGPAKACAPARCAGRRCRASAARTAAAPCRRFRPWMRARKRSASSAVRSSLSALAWPMCTRQRLNAGPADRIGSPRQLIVPEAGSDKPASNRSRLVLPLPLAPWIHNTSPG